MSLTLPAIVLKAKMVDDTLVVIKNSWDVKTVRSFFSSKTQEDIVYEFVLDYAKNLLSSFMIINGRCLTTEVKHKNVHFENFVFSSITIELD